MDLIAVAMDEHKVCSTSTTMRLRLDGHQCRGWSLAWWREEKCGASDKSLEASNCNVRIGLRATRFLPIGAGDVPSAQLRSTVLCIQSNPELKSSFRTRSTFLLSPLLPVGSYQVPSFLLHSLFTFAWNVLLPCSVSGTTSFNFNLKVIAVFWRNKI